jgi:energy-coupling factor transport system ATP-binding protein
MADSLRLQAFSYGYPLTDAFALRDVDFTVDGGLHLLAGDSGSGKSTLLRVSNGLVPHFHGGRVAGRAWLCGRDILATPTRELARQAGFLFQDCEMQSVYATVERDVAFGLENLGVARAEMLERVDESLESMGMSGLRARAVGSLSGGERQRLALAGVLAMRPALLALDEPLAQLDPEGVQPFIATLSEIARRGVAVIVAEHRLEHLLGAARSLTVISGQRTRGPAAVSQSLLELSHPPDIVVLGRRLGWHPLPLDVERARHLAPHLAGNGLEARVGGPIAWSLDGVSVGPGREPVLSGLRLCGRSGEVTVLMGRNGAGKTTLLRAIAGLLQQHEGAVMRTPGRVAYLPQNPTALLHRRTVRDEVAFTLRRARESETPDRVLETLRLKRVASRYPRDLSSGERQRAALAAVLAGSPRLALLDEPTRGMDGAARADLVRLLRELAARGTSVVMATHDSELAARAGDRVLRVENGTVRDLGSPNTALRGDSPYATQVGRLFADGPVTLEEALALL